MNLINVTFQGEDGRPGLEGPRGLMVGTLGESASDVPSVPCLYPLCPWNTFCSPLTLFMYSLGLYLSYPLGPLGLTPAPLAVSPLMSLNSLSSLLSSHTGAPGQPGRAWREGKDGGEGRKSPWGERGWG